jgi:GxxExxY protein
LFESVYEVVLAYELIKRGLQVERQVTIPIEYEGIKFDEGFRADVIVENKVLVELKSIESLGNVHKKQVLTYLKLTNMKLGLLINFGEALIKDGIVRIVNGL